MAFKRALFLLSAWLSAAASAQQVIAVDNAHLQMGSESRPPYILKPATSVVLDARNYKFQIPGPMKGKPINSLQIVMANHQQYSAVWNPDAARITLSPYTQRPAPEDAAFTGFSAHQQIVIALGNLTNNDFSVVWVALASIE